MINKRNKNIPILRSAEHSYKLRIDPKTYLPYWEDLDNPEQLIKDPLYVVDFSVIDFRDGTVTVKQDNGARNQLQISLHPDYIMVSCDCQSHVIKLCDHASALFAELITLKEYDFLAEFTRFPYNDQDYLDKYLEMSRGAFGMISARTRPEFGYLYNMPTAAIKQELSYDRPFAVSGQSLALEEGITRCFVICCQYNFSVPLLVPCQGIVNPQSGKVESFGYYLHPEEPSERLDEISIALMQYSSELNKLQNFEKVHRMYSPYQHEIKQDISKQFFQKWRSIFPILAKNEHTYYQHFYNKLTYRSKPSIHSVEKVKLSIDPIEFTFQLTRHDGFYQLRYIAYKDSNMVAVKKIFSEYGDFLFTTEDRPDTLYMFDSWEEYRMISALNKGKGVITILDSDINEFVDNVLSKLSIHYPVNFEIENSIPAMYPTVKSRHVELEDQGDYVSFGPSLLYENNISCIVLSDGTQCISGFGSDQIQIMHRDKHAEHQFREQFGAMHPAFATQQHLPYFYLSKSLLFQSSWLAKWVNTIYQLDIEIRGKEVITQLGVCADPAEVKISSVSSSEGIQIDIDVRFGKYKLDMLAIYKAVIKQHTLIKLAENQRAYLPQKVTQNLLAAFRLGELNDRGVLLSPAHYKVIDQISSAFAGGSIPIQLSADLNPIDQQDNERADVPENVHAELRGYQKQGFAWLVGLQQHNWGGILADDMGLGKTLQMLTLLQYLKNNGKASGVHLLLAPTSLLINWQREAQKFCPDLRVLIYHGIERKKDVFHVDAYDLIITSYGTAAVDKKLLLSMSFDYLILDEAQAIKNATSGKYKLATSLRASNRIVLTGTPVENSAMDLYSLMNFVNPCFFVSKAAFKHVLIAGGSDEHAAASHSVMELVDPFILRRTKAQVLPELPEKTEMTIYCQMQPDQRKYYDTVRRNLKAEITKQIDTKGLAQAQMHVLSGLMKLRQICNSPKLIDEHQDYTGSACKIDELKDHILQQTADHKILIFSAFNDMLELIKEELRIASIGYAYLTGKTKLAARELAVDKFNTQSDCRVFLIGLKAGGTGLNLTAADYVYLIDPWWNPAVENQAIDRCYRIGQDKKVMAYRMICKDTIEERIREIQLAKRQLTNDLIATDASLFSGMDKQDILQLLE